MVRGREETHDDNVGNGLCDIVLALTSLDAGASGVDETNECLVGGGQRVGELLEERCDALLVGIASRDERV